MKTGWIKRAISVILSGIMSVCLFSAAGVPAAVYADETEGGKYVSDVFIAYGKSEEKAAKWLKDNGWEPVKGDFNAGKASFFDDNLLKDQNVAAVMGIKRTDKEKEAITDMAVMNMKGGYSIPDYNKLLADKKAEIDEYVNNFMVVIKEYRANANNQGSAFGKERANVVRDVLNKFYDGGETEPYAANDTGMKLGELFLTKTRQEGNEKGGDLQQIMLETSGPAMVMVETLLALGADAGQESWLERAGGLTGDEMAENLPKYVPEAAGQDVADSAVSQYLDQRYGDIATTLAAQWTDVHDEIIWYETYNGEHDLWQQDGESDEDYTARVDKYFEDMKKADETKWDLEANRYYSACILCDNLYETRYEGEWGETLGDFFNPADGTDYSVDDEVFLPMAAALSDGQRAAMDFLSLYALLMIGFCDSKGLQYVLPDLKDIFEDSDSLSIYAGVKRAAFRGGAAITSEALMEQNMGRGDAFDRNWDNLGIASICSYAAAAAGIVALIAGGVMVAKGKAVVQTITESTAQAINTHVSTANQLITSMQGSGSPVSQALADNYRYLGSTVTDRLQTTETVTTKMGYAGRALLGIGGVLLIGAAIVKGVQMWKYYDRKMTPIPTVIVDESDIVTYLTDDDGKPILDDNGNQKKSIDFNTYEYYDAVKCNRPDVGEIGDWQDGVKEYNNKEHYCYDIADLNADMGQEWIALYVVKSKNKGFPILADSLTLKYGKDEMPKGCSKALHLFEYTNSVDLGDTAWAFNNDKKGVRFYWDEDTNAFPAETTASSFSGGQLALAGVGGFLIGAIGAAFALRPRRKKEEEQAA